MSIGEDTSATAGYWEGGYGLHVLPLALIGGVGGVLLSGGVLSAASMILVHLALGAGEPRSEIQAPMAVVRGMSTGE